MYIETTKRAKRPQWASHATTVDGHEVGWGARCECNELTAELKAKPHLARMLRDTVRDQWRADR